VNLGAVVSLSYHRPRLTPLIYQAQTLGVSTPWVRPWQQKPPGSGGGAARAKRGAEGALRTEKMRGSARMINERGYSLSLTFHIPEAVAGQDGAPGTTRINFASARINLKHGSLALV